MTARIAQLDELQVPRCGFFIPPYPKAVGSVGWLPFSERQNAAKTGEISPERVRAMLQGATVPSKVVEQQVKIKVRSSHPGASITLTADEMVSLTRETLLTEETISNTFDKLPGELKAAAGRAGDDLNAADAMVSMSSDMPSAIAQSRAWVLRCV